MVLASRPVASPSRFAARPVGAQSRHLIFLARKISSSELSSVVLPTPGPPVMMRTRLWLATLIASFWLTASSRPVFFSHHSMAFPMSITGWVDGWLAMARIFAAMPTSAARNAGRKMSVCSPICSSTSSRFTSSRASASRTKFSSTASNMVACSISISRGNAQCPELVASSKVCEIPAHARMIESRGMPTFSAI